MDEKQISAVVRIAVRETLRNLPDIKPERIAYPIKEAAELVGLPRNTLDDARSRGEFKAVKRCSKWMVTRAELLRWLDAQ